MKLFLCSLGVMGRRHLLGALQAGADVVAFDPSPASVEKAREAVEKAGISAQKVEYISTFPQNEKFDFAIFAETADYRCENFVKFATTNSANKIMLEKPIGRSPLEVEKVLAAAKKMESDGGKTFVNFPRRTWPFYLAMKEQWKNEKFIEMTLNGGALGLGCNGIHYLDTFVFLTSHLPGELKADYSKVSEDLVGSGRGPQFKDYSGQFVISKGASTFIICMSTASTATPILSLKTASSTVWIDENNYTFRKWHKTAGFEKPTYLYGQDYSIAEEGPVAYRDLISLTKGWVQGEIPLPSVDEVVPSHSILFDLLRKGQVSEPYLFT